MKRIAPILMLFLTTFLTAQTGSETEAVEQLKASVKKADLSYAFEDYMDASALADRILSVNPDNLYAKYYKLYSAYRLLLIASSDEPELFNKYVDIAEPLGQELEQNDKFAAEAKVLLAAINMMKLSRNPMEGMTLMPKIHALLDEAAEINENIPRIYLIRGVMLFNTPESFGGDVDEAIESFNTSILMHGVHKYDDALMPDWGLAETYAWLGVAMTRKGDTDSAREIYEKALTIEPDYGWIKYVLLPGLDSTKTE